MIDELLEAEGPGAVTSFLVREGHLFVGEAGFGVPGLVENMAQTLAAGMGRDALAAGGPVRIGLIGAIKDLEVLGLPQIGDVLRTYGKVLHEIGTARVAQAEVYLGQRLLAKAEFKIFLADP